MSEGTRQTHENWHDRTVSIRPVAASVRRTALILDKRQRGHWNAAISKLKALNHSDPEAFAMAKPARGRKRRADYDTIERIFFEILERVRSSLAARHVHIGHTVLEQMIFAALRAGNAEPVEDIVNDVLENGLNQPGFLIYPLFGFGLLHPKGTHFLKVPASAEIIDGASGIAVTSRLDSKDAFENFLERALAGLGVVGKLPRRHIDHHLAMKDLNKWLLRNPFMVVRIRSISMGARENQRSHVRSIAHRATLLGLISTLPCPRKGGRLMAGSTQGASNRDTLDIRHYFVFESPGDAEKELRSERVHLGPNAAPMLQFADLEVDVDPAVWNTPAHRNRIGALTDALLDLEDLQAAVEGGGRSVSTKANISRKLSTALHWTRRSFASFADPREAVVAMAVAFEALLSDGYSKGVTGLIAERAGICLKAQRGSPKLGRAIDDLFEWRGAIVHKGEGPDTADLRNARRAFALCFVEVVRRVIASSPEKTLVVSDLFSRRDATGVA